MTKKHALLLVLALFTAVVAKADHVAIHFDSAWVREAPPGVPMMAAYGVIRNTGSREIPVRSFSSPEFGGVELHETVVVDGQARMREVAPLVLQPGQSITLEPGGKHLMLMRPQGALKDGDHVTIGMDVFSDTRIFFTVPVKRQ